MVGPAYQRIKTPFSARAKFRLRLGLGLMLALLLVISGKLVLVQGFDLGENAEAAVKQRTIQQPLASTRGKIVDANGKVMAETVMRYDIVADQVNYGLVTDPSKNKTGALTADQATQDRWISGLAQVLGKSSEDVKKALTGTSRYSLISKSVSPEIEDKVAQLKVPGVVSQAAPIRQYPLGQVAGNIVGFINEDGSGGGLEYTQNSQLKGTDGERVYQSGKDGIVIPNAPVQINPAKNGQTIRTTINSDIQFYAQQAISNQVKKFSAAWGNIVVVQAKTGNIVAMAEDKTVDPNNPGATPADARDSRAVTNAIEPGSTEKTVTAAAAVQEGKATPSTQLAIPPELVIDGQVIRDAEVHGAENKTFAGVIGDSLNTGTVMVGSKLTKQQRYDYLRKFGIGEKTGIPLPGDTQGILATPDQWDGRQQYAVLFGQGVAQTPLQTAMIYQTVANNGVRLPPRLIDAYIDPDGTEHKTPIPGGTEVVSPEANKQVRDMLESVVSATKYNDIVVPGYRVGGKTGTAESPSANGGFSGYTASFAGMAPMDDPQYVVLVTVQHPQGNIFGISQGPVFNSVMGQVLQTEGVKPSTTPPVRLPQDF